MTGLGRRAVLAAAAPLLAGFRSASGNQVQAPRRRRLSFGLRSSQTALVTVPQLTTYLLTVTLEAPFDAVRVGLANSTPDPFRIGGICCCEADLWQPVQSAHWRYFSFGRTTGETIGPGLTGPQACTVPGNVPATTGARNVPRLFWSDWIEYRTAVAQGRPQMLFRALVPPQALPMTRPFGPGYVEKVVPESGPRFIKEAEIPGDFVTDLSITAPLPQISHVSPLFVIQYRSINPGFQIVVGGDSHLSSWFTFSGVAAFRMSQPSLPVSMWNVAWGGQPSNTFWPTLDEAIDAGAPSIVLIEGWTANDGMRPERDEAYLARVQETASRTMRQGGIPIILKGLPRTLYAKPEVGSWLHVNRQLDDLVPGAVVFDPDPIVQDPDRPGDWRPGFSNDTIHPNQDANFALAGPFQRLLRSLGV